MMTGAVWSRGMLTPMSVRPPGILPQSGGPVLKLGRALEGVKPYRRRNGSGSITLDGGRQIPVDGDVGRGQSMGKASGRDVGLLVLRTAMGGILFVHGAQKLFGWFGGGGIAGTAAGWEKIGFRPAEANVVAAGLGTAGGGALLALGLATPAAGAAVTGTMAVAAEMHVPGG